ncbi:MAG: leucine-rich repeat protein, partial [Oscillospiraceae bacterium]|nr:leucine-rich repeat protein [Oscillospiraceae bacterium]
MKKRLLAGAAALMFVFSIGSFDASVYAEESVSEETSAGETGSASDSESGEVLFNYRIKDDGTAEITEWLVDRENIIIPVMIGDEIISSIGDYAFYGLEKVSMVMIPPTIESIGEGAFLSCTALHSFVVADTVENIGGCAFGCIYDEENETITVDKDYIIYGYEETLAKEYAQKTGITYRDYTELMRFSEFNGKMTLSQADKRLHAAEIPAYVDGKPVVRIGEGLGGFKECIYFAEVIIPDTVEEIGSCAFQNTMLFELEIPESVSKIGFSAFEDCIWLQKINIPGKVTTVEKNTFSGCVNLESIDLHDKIESIGDYAFLNCVTMKSLSIPSSVKKIGDYAFSGCAGLESFSVSPDNKHYYDSDGVLFKETHWAGGNVTKDLVSYPAGRKGDSYTVPEGVQKILKGAFSSCKNLRSVTVQNGTEQLETYAFCDSDSLEKVTLPSSVWIIERNFDNCPNLTVYAEKTDKIEEYISKLGEKDFKNFVLTEKTEEPEKKDKVTTGDINA